MKKRLKFVAGAAGLLYVQLTYQQTPATAIRRVVQPDSRLPLQPSDHTPR